MNKSKMKIHLLFGTSMLNYDKIFRIAMFGHRDFYGYRQLEERLIPILRDLIRKKKFIEIYIYRARR